MSMPRITWDELPAAARAAVVEHTGPVHAATSALNGINSGIAARLQTGTGDVFIKGVPADHPQIRTQQREADINLHLPATCPRLLWRVRVSGWDLLGFELLAGRTADFAPGSADLPKVVAALHTLTHTPCPDLPLKRVDQRWAAYACSDALPLLDGDHLLHTDMAPHNILIADHAHLIDWAWPTRGPAWVDPGVWVIRLIDAGHTPAQAEDWIARLANRTARGGRRLRPRQRSNVERNSRPRSDHLVEEAAGSQRPPLVRTPSEHRPSAHQSPRNRLMRCVRTATEHSVDETQ